MRILLTGFGPFGTVVNNPTSRLVEHFAQAGWMGHDLTTHTLPVSYRLAAEEIARLLSEGKFDLAVLTGVAARAESVRLEVFGRNRSSTRKLDASEEVSSGRVLPAGPAQRSATVSTAGMVRALADAGIPARISRTAGDYVCNHTYFAALDTIAGRGLQTACLFVHMPCDECTLEFTDETPVLPFDQQVRVMETILALLATRQK